MIDEYAVRQYKQIEESCYRLNIPVDLYFRFLIKIRENPEIEQRELSKLEEEINSCMDGSD